MTSQGNLTEIVRRYDLYRQTPGVVSDPGVAVERLRRSVKIEIKMRNYYPDAPESLTVSYRYTDPVIAQRVVADLISIFQQANAAMRRQAATELEQFHTKIAEIETQLQELAPQRDLALLHNLFGRSLHVLILLRPQGLNTVEIKKGQIRDADQNCDTIILRSLILHWLTRFAEWRDLQSPILVEATREWQCRLALSGGSERKGVL